MDCRKREQFSERTKTQKLLLARWLMLGWNSDPRWKKLKRKRQLEQKSANSHKGSDTPMVDQQTIAAKIALLESVVWDILVDRFNSTPNPVSTARQYAETKLPSRHGVKTAPDLEPIREAVWQEFFDSVIAGVRMSEEQA
jgi:hypothetical protein